MGQRTFQRSTFCDGGGCVEVALPAPLGWESSTFRGAGTCVEVARPMDGSVYVRDGKDPGGPVLEFTREEWTAFVLGVQNGELGG